MVRGIEKFRQAFAGFEGKYSLIGGVACGLLMDEAQIEYRETKDFDVVLIIEAMDEAFGKALWDFIKKGDYEIRQKSSGEPEFYRFKNPKDVSYPEEIELFSRKSVGLHYEEKDRLTSIHISDEISSLSAILLDDTYYNFLQSGVRTIGGIQVLSQLHIIPFKAKAWLDLSGRKEKGEQVDSKNISKHKNDVFRLLQLVQNSERVMLPQEVKNDMKRFVECMEKESIDFKALKVRYKKDVALELLKVVYDLQ